MIIFIYKYLELLNILHFDLLLLLNKHGKLIYINIMYFLLETLNSN